MTRGRSRFEGDLSAPYESRYLAALACGARDRRDGGVGLGDNQRRGVWIARLDLICRVQHRSDGGFGALRLDQQAAIGEGLNCRCGLAAPECGNSFASPRLPLADNSIDLRGFNRR